MPDRFNEYHCGSTATRAGPVSLRSAGPMPAAQAQIIPTAPASGGKAKTTPTNVGRKLAVLLPFCHGGVRRCALLTECCQ